MLKTFLHFPITFIVLQILSSYITEGESKNVLINECPDYNDSRSGQIYTNLITIPFTRASQIAYEPSLTYSNHSITFELVAHHKSEYLLLCHLKSTQLKELTWTSPFELHSRDFLDEPEISINRHPYSYFTEAGYFYDESTGNYYDTDKYCVQSISDDEIKLRVCVVNKNCSNSYIPNLYCVPKCCAIDETLSIWTQQCIRLNETKGRTPWELPVYQGLTNPNKLAKPDLIYHLAHLPETCSLLRNENGTTEEYGYNFVTASRVDHYSNSSLSYDKTNVKFILPNNHEGKLQIVWFYNHERKWMVESFRNYCVDGFHIEAPNATSYTGNQEQFGILFCPDENNDMWEEENYVEWTLSSWIYVGSTSIPLLFLLATIILYSVLWDKHNLHGLTIASYTSSTLLRYALFTIAQLLAFHSLSKEVGFYDGNAFCYAVATSAHFFLLSTYMWLTILNFDVWLTFNSMKAKKRNTKEWKKFGIYSCVAWGFPLCLVAIFVTINEVYRDPLSLVHVPDYANGSCFVSSSFRGDYVFLPMAILLTLNFILISMTMWIFIKARNTASKLFITGGMLSYNRYNAMFFIKLFTIMGGHFIIDFVTWYYDNKPRPWLVLALECMKECFPVVLFFLFCLNDRVVAQLEDKYPRFTEKIRPFLKICLKRKTGVSQNTTGNSS